MNNKYLLISILFLTGLSVHSFDAHFEHHDEEYITECQACEHNTDIPVILFKSHSYHQRVILKTNLLSRFASYFKTSKVFIEFKHTP